MIFSIPGPDGPVGEDAVIERHILAIAAGDIEAAGLLYAKTKTAVYSFALSILKNPADAEDITQDVYIRICDFAQSYKPKGRPLPWVLSITRNLSLMKLRKAGREGAVSDEELERICVGDAVTHDDRIVLTAALKGLSDEELQIITLHAVSGFKHREIANLLELPLPTVLSKYHRALKKLKLQLEGGDMN